jgi:hypothetical protein
MNECERVQAKLNYKGDPWSAPILEHRDRLHIAQCEKCQKAWAKRVKIEGVKSLW